MSISITDRGDLLDGGSRLLVERRLLFALSRFDSRIKQIHLVVNDENGPRGGIDKSCCLSISLSQAADVVILDKDSDIIRCISRAAERAGRSVARAVEKSNFIARSRPAFIDPTVVAPK